MPAKKPAKKAPAKRTSGRVTPKKVKEDGPVRLELACGQNKEEGWIGVDVAPTEQADVVWDLEVHPWPFEDNSVDEARCSHYVEHVHDLIGFMNELHRILKPGAQATIITPYYTSVRAFQDPTHVRFMSEQSYLYFNQEWMRNNGLDHYGITADFDFTYGYNMNGDWVTRSDDTRSFAIQHYWNVVDDLFVTLTARG